VAERIDYELMTSYRETFLDSPQGQTVFADLLSELFILANVVPDEEARILHNAGLKILAKMGIMLPNQFQEVVSALARVPAPQKPRDPKETENNG
jgi:hypothetical protein